METTIESIRIDAMGLAIRSFGGSLDHQKSENIIDRAALFEAFLKDGKPTNS